MPTNDSVPGPDELDPERIELVREHMKTVLASHAFEGSKRAQSFLQLVVEHALAGRYDDLRERMIGAEMFGRPIDYDTANDAVVRVKATEVRRKLAQHYQELKEVPPVRIELPSGSYVPKFYWESPVQPPAAPEPQLPVQPASAPQEREKAHKVQLEPVSKPPRRKAFVLAAVLCAVGLIAVIAYVVLRNYWKAADGQDGIHSIVVLPLENLSGRAEQQEFADSMTEELTADLGQISALRVISRTSAMTYKVTKKTLPEIARELNVDSVVEGSVLREGNQVRIIAQLIDAKTDRHIWAQTYTRDVTSVLTLQGEVAQAIADKVRIEVTPEEQARLSRVRPINPEAQNFYLQGMQALNTGDPAKAIGFLLKAIAREPSYAQAHAALANSYGWMGGAGWMPYTEAFPKEKAAALRAIELDDALPDGHTELANAVMNVDWDWATQEKEFKRALELNPSSAPVRWAYASYLQKIGQTQEAMKQSGLALDLDPVSSRAYMNAAYASYFARRYDEALGQMQRASELAHRPEELTFPLAEIYAEKGLYPEAIRQFQLLGDAPHALGHMGNAYARSGNAAAARQLLSRLEDHINKDGVGRYEIALVYAGLGDKEHAFAWLRKAYETRDKGITYLKIDPCLDPLRSDPRLPELIRLAGFPKGT